MANIKMIICDGGVSRDFFDVRPQKECEYLIDQGHDVEVIILYRDEDSTPLNIKINGVNCTFFNCRGKITNWLASGLLKKRNNILYPIWFLIFVYNLRAYLNDNFADYLHTQNLYGTIAGIMVKTKNQPVIFDMREFYGMQGDRGIVAIIKRKLSGLLCKKVYKVLYVHPMQKQEAPIGTQHKFLHLPNYPDTNYIYPLKKERNDGDPLFISYIGGIRERQKDYFEILARACAEAGGVKLSLHGGGNGYQKIKYLQEKYPDTVKVTGKYDGIKETARLFSEGDLLYCCYDISVVNWQRGEAIKMFEAIATKTPLVVSRGSYMESFVIKNDIGYSLDGGNYNEVLSFIKYIKNHREELEIKAENTDKIRGQYTWDNVVKVLDEAYL